MAITVIWRQDNGKQQKFFHILATEPQATYTLWVSFSLSHKMIVTMKWQEKCEPPGPVSSTQVHLDTL